MFNKCRSERNRVFRASSKPQHPVKYSGSSVISEEIWLHTVRAGVVVYTPLVEWRTFPVPEKRPEKLNLLFLTRKLNKEDRSLDFKETLLFAVLFYIHFKIVSNVCLNTINTSSTRVIFTAQRDGCETNNVM